MFCQLVYLRHCVPTRIRRVLEELPETLDKTYEHMLRDIDDQTGSMLTASFNVLR